MKYRLLLLFFFIAFTALQMSAQGTDKRLEMKQELELFSQEFGQIFDELKRSLGEARFFLDTDLDMKKLDEEGTMRIMGDTIDLSMIYDFMAKSFGQFPEQMRPDDRMLEEMKKSAKELPDMLLESKDFFNNEQLNELFGDFFGDFNIEPIEPERDENGDIIPRKRKYKTPKPDKKKKRKTVRI